MNTSIADDIDYQTSSLATAVRMLRDLLAVDRGDPVAVAETVDRLFFVSDGIEAVQARLERIADEVRTLHGRTA